jgi:GNAT superfamily N-acetyltransferase
VAESTIIPVPPGKIAAVVTYLEMTARPDLPPAAPPGPEFTLRHVRSPEVAWYRALFRAIGEDWLWFSRMDLSDDQLLAVLRDPRIEIHALYHNEREVGLVELVRRSPPDIELAFFGLVPDMIGRGLGRYLMDRAIDLAWCHGPRRFWVHTCTLDHPGALSFYCRSGFRPYRQQVEIEDDPRLTGVLRPDAAPQWPIVRG